ncbi:MAG: hypothetical protein JJE04_06945 [Acidobacteriia bacterium]|nr:hypothetical protein [Terriglobia bacterium]
MSRGSPPARYRCRTARQKERGRELFYRQAEKGEGVSSAVITVAIAKYHAKQAELDVQKAEKAGG